MNNKLKEFLDNVCGYIRHKSVHEEVRSELENHIEDVKNGYIEKGFAEEKALDMAILDMGDCSEIGKKLDRQHRPKTEWSIFALTAIIALIGGIIMFASSKFQSHQAVDFGRYILFGLMGVAVSTILYFFDYTKLKKFTLPIYITAFVLLIVTLTFGNGDIGRRFLKIGSLTISSEYTSLLFLIAFAGFIEKFRGSGNIAIMYLAMIGGASLLPIIMLPNLAQAFILLISYGCLLLAATLRGHFGGQRKFQLWSLGGIFASLCIISLTAILSTPYRLDRVISFITRGNSDPMGIGWQQSMADKWLSISKLFGKSTDLVQGYPIDMAMPEVTTDYILINIISTLGWAVGIVLILAVGALIVRMTVTSRKIKNEYGFFLSFGFCIALSVQFIINILMNFNLFPLMGVSLPFVSYGGMGYIVNMAFVGIILSVWRRNNLILQNKEAYRKVNL